MPIAWPRSLHRAALAALVLLSLAPGATADPLQSAFDNPPANARPWVYWMVMDGNLTRQGITADLEAMRTAGIGGAILLEVDVGVARGPVRFMSPEWQQLVKHAFNEADRLGIEIALGAGPGWCGSGGPWVRPEQSMQHLVASEVQVQGPMRVDLKLPQPRPRTPFFGEGTLGGDLHRQWSEFYRDVKVLAFRTPAGSYRLPEVDEKALYYRAPYSSQPGVKPYLTPVTEELPHDQCIPLAGVLDLTSRMGPDGRLDWQAPAGDWTLMRFGRTITGQTTRPAPLPGLGLESDKFDRDALDAHFASFIEALLKTTGRPRHRDRGLTTIHFDSWEMGSQNWSPRFAAEFTKRRGYDPTPYLPTMVGLVVQSVEVTERFLWDLRRTAQELVVENHAVRLRELCRRYGLKLSIEPYDLNPAGDLALGGVADVPQCEFWSRGFNTTFSAYEAASIGHTTGRNIVAAESFTSEGDAWQLYPALLKDQGDWALATGVNRFIFHRYAHQPWMDRFPGMTFGPYGVHWDRTNTWWPMAGAYHTYLARCQALLRQGLPVADILYLDAEGAPNVFRAPSSATLPGRPDRRGYTFDGCSAATLMGASVRAGRVVLPSGTSYRLLVLPRLATMTPALLRKVKALADGGARILGVPPAKSPSLAGYPASDREVAKLAGATWRRPTVMRDQVGPHDDSSVLSKARWIWYPEGNPAVSAPPGPRWFSRYLVLEAKPVVAVAWMAVDNRYSLTVNGHTMAGGGDFHVPGRFDVARYLRSGRNVVSVRASNDGPGPNPAGLLGVLTMTFAGGKESTVVTDATWQAALSPGGAETDAMVLGPAGMGPWGTPTAGSPELYPAYETTARILSGMGVAPDFETSADLRVSHRTTPQGEVYFVGNRTDRETTANCRFRVVGLQPELWDPLTGERRPLPTYTVSGGRTSVPLRFDPGQAYFVVFRRLASRAAGSNFGARRVLRSIAGPWQVRFDPRWGGPSAPVTMTALQDWIQRPEEGIRHYSGTATYEATFAGATGSGLQLELGDVRAMARVAVNGRDLGVAWCAPWRVRLPAGLLKPTGNRLTVQVANLWCNRIIGDSALPREKQFTSLTWGFYGPGSPLQPSGLLGPVKLVRFE